MWRDVRSKRERIQLLASRMWFLKEAEDEIDMELKKELESSEAELKELDMLKEEAKESGIGE